MPVSHYNCSRCKKKFPTMQDVIAHVAFFRTYPQKSDCVLKFKRENLVFKKKDSHV